MTVSSNMVVVQKGCMVNMVLAISGRMDEYHSLSYRWFKRDRLHLDYHLVRDPYQLALWSGLKTDRSSAPTRLIRVE